VGAFTDKLILAKMYRKFMIKSIDSMKFKKKEGTKKDTIIPGRREQNGWVRREERKRKHYEVGWETGVKPRRP